MRKQSIARYYVRRYFPENMIILFRKCQRIWQTPIKKAAWAEARLSGKRVIHVLHIPKTGGTAVKKALEPVIDGANYLLVLRGHGFSLKDVPRGDKVIFILRDPATRFVSGFYSRKNQGKPVYDAPWTVAEMKAFSYFGSPNELALALKSNDYTRQKKAKFAMQRIRHVNKSLSDWLKDIDYIKERKEDILFVGFQESLSSDFELLKKIMNFDRDVVLPAGDKFAHKRSANLDDSLDQQAELNIKEWFKVDYEIIEYCKMLRNELVVNSKQH